MAYRRYPPNRKYAHNAAVPDPPEDTGLNPTEVVEKDIPLPNEAEQASNAGLKENLRQRLPFLDLFKFRIGIEEILLIGLIILLLQEGIRDELLVILLIYVLIT